MNEKIIYKEDNYYISTIISLNNKKKEILSFVITDNFDNKIIRKIIEQNATYIVINSALGCIISENTILRNLPENIIGIEVIGFDFDFSYIYHLKKLKYFSYSAYTKYSIDFTQFPLLEDVFLGWWPKANSIFNCKSLKKLYISGYQGKSIREFTKLTNLEELKITARAMADLSGIEELRKLKKLCLYLFSKLDNIEILGKLENLEELEIENNKKIYDISPIGNLKNLKKLYLNDLGKIKSLKPLQKLSNLEVLLFYGTTNIEDGDISFLKEFGLKDVAFANRKHYSVKNYEVPGDSEYNKH